MNNNNQPEVVIVSEANSIDCDFEAFENPEKKVEDKRMAKASSQQGKKVRKQKTTTEAKIEMKNADATAIGKRRGRKGVDPNDYIRDNEAKLSQQKKELEECKGKIKSKDREKKRNKMKALESRVKKKKLQKHFSTFPTQFRQSFEEMAQLLIEEIPCTCRDNIMALLPSKRDQTSSLQPRHHPQSAKDPDDFKKRLSEQITVLQ